MPSLSYDSLKSAFAGQSLFEDKTWRLSPDAWPITAAQLQELEAIGAASLEFHQALETLYLRSVAGKNLLRNKPLTAPWVADYLERGKPEALIAHARDPRTRGMFPTVLRPDLLMTDEGFVMTELDSVPGGIGLTAYLNRLYRDEGPVLGADDAMIKNFHACLAGLRPEMRNPLIALVVSDEAATYRPEMEWLAHQLQVAGHRVFCMKPEDLFPLGGALFFDVEGNPEKIDIIYRFFELFDLASIKTAPYIFEAWASGDVAIAPPLRTFQEEKLAFGLFHHHLLKDYWEEALGGRTIKLLRTLIPQTWIMDPAPLPPGAVLDGPKAAARPLADWRDLIGATQKERDLIIKISGFHETAWGARSIVLGSDSSREEWQAGVEGALKLAPTNLHVLQVYRKPRRLGHSLYGAEAPHEAKVADGRLRLCPYYFLVNGKTRLSGALATFCPPDKKIIHGMQDAALLPVRIAAG
ncbi:MAG TPA: hypothetical protein VIJ19_07005 [Opitutaceae bacterium]